MDNFETQKEGLGIKRPKINWKKYITKLNAVSAIAIILAIIVVYNFWWLPYKNGLYTKGLEAGRLEGQANIINWELSQVQQFGGFGLTMPAPGGGTTTVNMVVQQPPQ